MKFRWEKAEKKLKIWYELAYILFFIINSVRLLVIASIKKGKKVS